MHPKAGPYAFWWCSRFSPRFLLVTRSLSTIRRPRSTIWTPGSAYLNNNNLPHKKLVYPPKIYFPTLIIVTVGPLPSHREWNVLAAQPSTDACQQRFQAEFTLRATGDNQLLKVLKWFMLFPTITESSKSEQISTSIKNSLLTTDGWRQYLLIC